MKVIHSTGTSNGRSHSNFKGYDATVGKIASLTGRAHRCSSCERAFKTPEGLLQHQHDKHTGESA